MKPGERLRQSEYAGSNYTVNTVNTVNVTRQGYVAALTTNKGWTLMGVTTTLLAQYRKHDIREEAATMQSQIKLNLTQQYIVFAH